MKNLHRSTLTPRLAIALLFASFGVSLHSETEDTIDRTLQIARDGKLIVDTDVGSIEIHGTSEPDVTVNVTRKAKARSDARERAILEEHEVTIEAQGKEVWVRARRKNDKGRGWNLRNESYRVTFTIRVPDSLATDLKTSGGGISLHDLNSANKVRTSGGGLKFANVRGSIDAKTSGGGIELSRCSGQVRATTSGGGIRVKECEGDLVVSTSGGGIDIDRLAGHIDGVTSGGPINASLLSAISQDCRLETSGGGIVVSLDPKAAFELDASTSGGRVVSELPVTVQGEHHNTSLRGTVNGGGKLLKLRTSGGGIRLKKLAA